MNSDNDLWDRVLAGESAALGAVFDCHLERVYRHALSLLKNVHDAEDVAAMAFFELWRHRARVRVVGGSVLPWLLTTATNLCRNSTRSARRYRALLDSLPRSEASASAEQAAFDGGDPFDSVNENLLREMRRLPEKTAALLILTAIQGYSIGEASQAVGLPAGAARARLSRAKASLRSSTLHATAHFNPLEETP